MTLQGAIQQLHDMRCNEKFPIYYKPAIDEVIKTIVADAQEVRRGRWIMPQKYDNEYRCSICGEITKRNRTPFCGWCGARMEAIE